MVREVWEKLPATEIFFSLVLQFLGKDFIVWIDACIEGIGVVLMHEGHIICYESRKIKEYKKKNAIHDLELLAIVHALKVWRHYLQETILIEGWSHEYEIFIWST